MSGYKDYGQILENARDVSRYIMPFMNAYPSAHELEAIFKRNDWEDELRKRKIYQKFIVTEETENADKELMPPPVLLPIKKEKVHQDDKMQRKTRSSKRNVTTSSSATVRRSSQLNEKSLLIIEDKIKTITLEETGVNENVDNLKTSSVKQEMCVEEITVSAPNIQIELFNQSINQPLNNHKQQNTKVPNETAVLSSNQHLTTASTDSDHEETKDEAQNDLDNSVNLNKKLLASDPSSTFTIHDGSPAANGTFIVDKSPNSDVLSNGRPRSALDKVKQTNNYMSPVKSKIANFEKLTSKSKIPLTSSGGKKFQTTVSRTIQERQKQLLSGKTTTPNNTVRHAPLTNSTPKRIDYEEAQRKKAAMLQARAEENRLRREEKQSRAQRIRENQELEKQQALIEAERQKRQKLEERLLVQEQRRKMKAKVSELRRQAVMNKIKSRKGTRDHVQTMENDRPIYMVQSMLPPLPTPNYVQNDDEPDPRQVDKLQIKELLNELPYIPRQIVNTAFFLTPITPDLAKIFPSIKKTKLQRNSSAVWERLPDFSKFDIEAGLSEDDEETDY